MARGKQGKVTQKAMVEAALQEKGWDAGPQELQVVIKDKFGTELPPQVISNYKSNLKKESGKSTSPVGKRGRKPGPAFEDFEAVRGLVNKLGADQVKKLVEMAGMFS